MMRVYFFNINNFGMILLKLIIRNIIWYRRFNWHKVAPFGFDTSLLLYLGSLR